MVERHLEPTSHLLGNYSDYSAITTGCSVRKHSKPSITQMAELQKLE